MSERVAPFSSGTQYQDWLYNNCARCRKWDSENTTSTACEIDYAITTAHMSDGKVSPEIAERMGYTEAKVNDLTWPCKEFEEAK